MASAIDATKPVDGIPANKAELRANLLAAKTEIEALQVTDENELTGTSLTVNAALFGAAASLMVRCTSTSAVTITLAADVPVGKSVHIVQWASGLVVAQAGASAAVRKTVPATLTTAEQYDLLVLTVARNSGGSAAEWLML